MNVLLHFDLYGKYIARRFPECVVKGSCFLSGGLGVVDCLWVVFVLRFSNLVAAVSMGKVKRLIFCDV